MAAIQANRKGSAIFASGGDQHQRVNLPVPREPLSELYRQLDAHEATRPQNRDVSALGPWILAKERLALKIVLAGGKVK